MSKERIFTNARIIGPEDVIHGSLQVRDGRITDISEGAASGEDLDGDYLLPGLVELHTDHLENHYAPRPGVRWNPLSSVLAHDAQVAAAGITTVLDALRLGMEEDSALTVRDMRSLGDAIHRGEGEGIFRAEHFIHLRCEVSTENVCEGIALFEGDRRVRMASLMDHTPGQRQFADLDQHRAYFKRATGDSDEAYAARVETMQARARKWSDINRRRIAATCAEWDVHIASHDDATAEHVEEALRDGVAVSEFPTTVEAAKTANHRGLRVLMGSPNVVRGGSHTGNVSAIDLARDGHLDILSSDYAPVSLLQAAFVLTDAVEAISLPQAVAMVSKTPAETIGLNDRGAIETGRRADLVRVRLSEGTIPVVRGVWRNGERVS